MTASTQTSSIVSPRSAGPASHTSLASSSGEESNSSFSALSSPTSEKGCQTSDSLEELLPPHDSKSAAGGKPWLAARVAATAVAWQGSAARGRLGSRSQLALPPLANASCPSRFMARLPSTGCYLVRTAMALVALLLLTLAMLPAISDIVDKEDKLLQQLFEATLFSNSSLNVSQSLQSPGERLAAEGLQAHHPLVLIPGIVSTPLELWKARPCMKKQLRQRIWGEGIMLQKIFLDPQCWLQHIRLNSSTGMDPDGIRLRASSGLRALESLVGAYTVWGSLLQNAAQLGYDESSMVMVTYDWRLAYDLQEQRDRLYSRTKLQIEQLYHYNDNKRVVVVAHSMGNAVWLYFTQWVSSLEAAVTFSPVAEESCDLSDCIRPPVCDMQDYGAWWREEQEEQQQRRQGAGGAGNKTEGNSTSTAVEGEGEEEGQETGSSSSEHHSASHGSPSLPPLYQRILRRFTRRRDMCGGCSCAHASWTDKYIESYLNLAGPLLGAPKVLPAIYSGEMKDTAMLPPAFNLIKETFISRVSLRDTFRTFWSMLGMLPMGGNTVWGGREILVMQRDRGAGGGNGSSGSTAAASGGAASPVILRAAAPDQEPGMADISRQFTVHTAVAPPAAEAEKEGPAGAGEGGAEASGGSNSTAASMPASRASDNSTSSSSSLSQTLPDKLQWTQSVSRHLESLSSSLSQKFHSFRIEAAEEASKLTAEESLAKLTAALTAAKGKFQSLFSKRNGTALVAGSSNSSVATAGGSNHSTAAISAGGESSLHQHGAQHDQAAAGQQQQQQQHHPGSQHTLSQAFQLHQQTYLSEEAEALAAAASASSVCTLRAVSPGIAVDEDGDGIVDELLPILSAAAAAATAKQAPAQPPAASASSSASEETPDDASLATLSSSSNSLWDSIQSSLPLEKLLELPQSARESLAAATSTLLNRALASAGLGSEQAAGERVPLYMDDVVQLLRSSLPSDWVRALDSRVNLTAYRPEHALMEGSFSISGEGSSGSGSTGSGASVPQSEAMTAYINSLLLPEDRRQGLYTTAETVRQVGTAEQASPFYTPFLVPPAAGLLPKRWWMNPLVAPLPFAPSTRIYCMYGVGLPTERAYQYRQALVEERQQQQPVLEGRKTQAGKSCGSAESAADAVSSESHAFLQSQSSSALEPVSSLDEQAKEAALSLVAAKAAALASVLGDSEESYSKVQQAMQLGQGNASSVMLAAVEAAIERSREREVQEEEAQREGRQGGPASTAACGENAAIPSAAMALSSTTTTARLVPAFFSVQRRLSSSSPAPPSSPDSASVASSPDAEEDGPVSAPGTVSPPSSLLPLPDVINTDISQPEALLGHGVHLSDGDATIPLLSLGYMCAKGWRQDPVRNPSGTRTIIREYPADPAAAEAVAAAQIAGGSGAAASAAVAAAASVEGAVSSAATVAGVQAGAAAGQDAPPGFWRRTLQFLGFQELSSSGSAEGGSADGDSAADTAAAAGGVKDAPSAFEGPLKQAGAAAFHDLKEVREAVAKEAAASHSPMVQLARDIAMQLLEEAEEASATAAAGAAPGGGSSNSGGVNITAASSRNNEEQASQSSSAAKSTAGRQEGHAAVSLSDAAGASAAAPGAAVAAGPPSSSSSDAAGVNKVALMVLELARTLSRQGIIKGHVDLLRGSSSADHVDILMNEQFILDTLRIAAGQREAVQDRVVSRIHHYSSRVQDEL